MEDSQQYVCYQLGQLVGVVRVDVSSAPIMNVTYWMNILNGAAIVYIVVTFLGGVYMNERVVVVKGTKVPSRRQHQSPEEESLLPQEEQAEEKKEAAAEGHK
ncbi:hypothetical protein AAG570_004562 [Ranatra chinensis]|uniref:Uncharacterized protein n=1 Tax=Ranatra chinensis TaxID=642074 RepID=A0ABD0Y185_9HEMI